MPAPIKINKNVIEYNLNKFYENWYFYQTYKNKPHYDNPFKIRYE